MLTKTNHQITPLFRADGTAPSKSVTILFEGRAIEAPSGVSVAAALLLNGVEPFRTTPVKSEPRAPYCMMGVCFDCLVEINGMPSRQACQIPVKDGLVIRRQEGASELELPVDGGTP